MPKRDEITDIRARTTPGEQSDLAALFVALARRRFRGSGMVTQRATGYSQKELPYADQLNAILAAAGLWRTKPADVCGRFHAGTQKRNTLGWG